jgi:hypothetical protein
LSDFGNSVAWGEEMTTARATGFVRDMVKLEASGPGDTEGALHRLSQHYGIGFWTLSHLRKGNAKKVDSSLLEQLRAAYLDLCERQIAALQHGIALERAVTGDDDLSNYAAEAAALAEKVAARRAMR